MSPIFPFRRSRGPFELAIGMAGVRLGERLLHVGVGDPRLFAALAAKAGLTGRACAVVDNAGAAAILERAAADYGVFVEVETAPSGGWPFSGGSFDIAILDGNALADAPVTDCQARLSDTLAAIRPGGRALAIYRAPRTLAARLGFEPAHRQPGATAQGLATLLRQAGLAPVRVLAEREGLVFVEAFRPADPSVI